MSNIKIKYKQAIETTGARVKERMSTAIANSELLTSESITQIIEECWDGDGVASVIMKHIYAELRRNDFQIADGEEFSAEVLMREIGRKAGYALGNSLDEDAIIQAMDTHLTKFINKAMSTQLTSVTDSEQLKEGLTQTIVAQIQGGGLGKVIADGKANIAKMGNIATSQAFQKLQARTIREGHRKLMRRIYQKRFERTHEKVWV